MRGAIVLIGLLALTACGRGPPKAAEAAPPASHNWSSVSGRDYTYYPRALFSTGTIAARPTIVRYLGRGSDGVYAVSEIQDGATVVVSCALPCTDMRLRGQNLDHSGAIGGDSVSRGALDDAIHGQLQVYIPPAPGLK